MYVIVEGQEASRSSTLCTSKPPLHARHASIFSRMFMNTIFRRNMSRFTIANLPRMEVTALSQELLALKSPDNSIAVIDVRDGGTQIQSLHYPYLDISFGNNTPLTLSSQIT